MEFWSGVEFYGLGSEKVEGLISELYGIDFDVVRGLAGRGLLAAGWLDWLVGWLGCLGRIKEIFVKNRIHAGR